MRTRSALHALRRHVVDVVVALAVVSTALVTGQVAGVAGTLALWNDSATLPAQTITAGTPAIEATGFDDLSGLTFSATNRLVSTQVTVQNTGNVPLSDIAASIQFDNPDWTGAVVAVSFVPLNGDGVLAPGDSRDYTVTITFTDDGIAQLPGTIATATAVVTGQAGASWVASSTPVTFGLSTEIIEDITPPPAGGNITITTSDSYSGTITWPAFPGNWNFTVTFGGIPGVYDVNNGWPVYQLGNNNIPGGVWPAPGTTRAVALQVLAYDSTTGVPAPNNPVATGTIWIYLASSPGASLQFFASDPGLPAVSASMARLVAPAIAGPGLVTPAPSTLAPQPGPAAPEPVPALEPTLTPAPAPVSEPGPAELDEVPLTATEQEDGSLDLSWDNPSGIPEETTYELRLNGQPAGDETGTTNPTFTLRQAPIRPEMLTAEGEVHELTIEIVAQLPDGTSQTIARGTVWAIADADGSLTLISTDPAA